MGELRGNAGAGKFGGSGEGGPGGSRYARADPSSGGLASSSRLPTLNMTSVTTPFAPLETKTISTPIFSLLIEL